jgi:formylglycine-generating enzyme required for sulfatase activity
VGLGRRRNGIAAAVLVAALGIQGCEDPEAPPFPEALVVVDTDLPVPLVASRLRVDLYSQDGTWFDSSDFGRPDRRDWPASFSVFSDDQSRERLVWVRLRAYPEGAVDTYRGERFRDNSLAFEPADPTEVPRLVRDGVDVTPAIEPSPLLTVDRLILVRLRPETRVRARVVLHGACVGTMVRMGAVGSPVVGDVETCVDTEKTRVPVTPVATDDDLTTPSMSVVGTWLTGACTSDDERVCIPGGATILGSRENSDFVPGTSPYLDPAPPRVFGLTPFHVDRDELTVGALKALIESGYDGALPISHEGNLAQPTSSSPNTGCTWSPTASGRDDYPVTCVSFRAAREICQFRGGDLLTEAQWEHVATIAGHPQKVRYPWGQELPTCERAIFGRVPITLATPECAGGAGPRAPSEAAADVSPLGVRNLFGSVLEWVLDDAAPFDSSTWANVDVVNPKSVRSGARRILRGNSWMSEPLRPFSRFSPSDDQGYPPVGVRCAYPLEER